MSFFKKLGVYRRVPKDMIRTVGGKRISVKWLDTNKGDRDNPNYRSRLVGREYNDSKDDMLYASTPPLAALLGVLRTCSRPVFVSAFVSATDFNLIAASCASPKVG